MGIDFRVIRILLRTRLDRAYLALLWRTIGGLGEQDKAGFEELEVRLHGLAEQHKKFEELALYTSIGNSALSLG
jgi:hypothetical protein